MLAEDLAPLRLDLLGPLRLERDGIAIAAGWPKQQAVLVVLALHADRVVSRDRLVDAVWGEQTPRSAVSDVHTYLSKLRRLLDGPADACAPRAPLLVTESGGYRLRIAPEAVDAIKVAHDIDHARALRKHGDTGGALSTLSRALAHWRGEALMGVPGPLAGAERRRLEQLKADALEEQADLRLALGQHALVMPGLFTMVHDNPLRERPWSLLLLALYRSGRIGEALTAFQQMRRTFIDELGIEPAEPLQRLHQQIIAGDPALDPPRASEQSAAEHPRPDRRPDPAQPSGAATVRSHRAPAELPHAIPAFVGRHDVLHQIEAAYADGVRAGSQGSTTVVALHGMAGVGKTALAVHWAHQHADRFPDGQLYVNLRGHDANADPLPTALVLTRFLRALGVMPALVPVDAEEQAGVFRSLLADRRMLLLLDNAASEAQVELLLPGSSGCMVIVTSRLRLTGFVRRSGARPIPLAVLDPEESLTLLRSVIGADRVDAAAEHAREICRLADQLPLALRIVAASLAADTHLSLADTTRALSRGDRLAMAGTDLEERSAVRAAFDVSNRALPPAARRMFRLLGLIPGPDFDIGTAAAVSQTSNTDAAELLDVLVAANLVDRQARQRFQLHDLLRLYAAEQAAKEEDPQSRVTAITMLLDWYIRVTDTVTRSHGVQFMRLPRHLPDNPLALPEFEDQRSAVRWLEAERPNLLAAIHGAVATDNLEAAWSLADALRGFFRLRPYGSEWLAAASAGLDAANRAGDARAQAAMHLSLADSYQALGQCSSALLHDARALAISTEVEWAEARAAALSGLGRSHWTIGELDQATGHLDEALNCYVAIGSESGRAACLGSLGRAWHDLGDLDAALALYRESDALNEQTRSQFGAALGAFYLGAVNRDLGRHGEAEAHLRRALAGGRASGLVHAEALAAAYLAVLCQDVDSADGVREFLAEARRLAERTGDRRVESECRNAVADTLLRLGRMQDAAAEFGAALEAAESTQYMRGRIRALIGLAEAQEEGKARKAAAERAWDLASSRGYRLMQVEALCALAGSALLGEPFSQGDGTDAAAARGRLHQAEALARELDYRPGIEAIRRVRERLGKSQRLRYPALRDDESA